MTPIRLVVMGVCGSGKSTAGLLLAQRLGVEFLEGDDLHPVRNIERLAAGTALSDDDRAGWLRTLAGRLAAARADGRGLVVTCSALKRSYRDILRRGDVQLQLVYLAAPSALLAARMGSRQGHYMPASLLQSQLADLEPPGADENALALDAGQDPAAIVDAIAARLA